MAQTSYKPHEFSTSTENKDRMQEAGDKAMALLKSVEIATKGFGA